MKTDPPLLFALKAVTMIKEKGHEYTLLLLHSSMLKW